MVPKTPPLLSPEQRAQFTHIPPDLTDREISRFDTLTPDELAAVNRRRRPAHRLGFAVHCAVLRLPGRPLTEIPVIPERVLAYLAAQVGVPLDAFARYGARLSTV